MILAPVAVAQANAVPYTIIYAPPGDQSTSTFTSAEAFATDYTVGSSTAQTNSTAKDESFEEERDLRGHLRPDPWPQSAGLQRW